MEKHVLILLSNTDSIFATVCKKRFSKAMGWDAVITSSEKEAQALIEKKEPQLVLTDIVLKEGTGFELLEAIRSSKNKRLSTIPILVLTDLSQAADKEKAFSLGATEYLLKSDISLTEVMKKIEGLLS